MHRRHVETLLADAAAAHEALLGELSPQLAASLPVDATGVTEAIDHLGAAAGLTTAERRELIRPHGVNPAVLHARVFGRAPLTAGTVLASYVDGARVRAAALQRVAEAIGGAELGTEIRVLLADHPPPVDPAAAAAEAELRATYAAHEAAAVRLADALDAAEGHARG
jgi:hypothetical protein